MWCWSSSLKMYSMNGVWIDCGMNGERSWASNQYNVEYARCWGWNSNTFYVLLRAELKFSMNNEMLQQIFNPIWSCWRFSQHFLSSALFMLLNDAIKNFQIDDTSFNSSKPRRKPTACGAEPSERRVESQPHSSCLVIVVDSPSSIYQVFQESERRKKDWKQQKTKERKKETKKMK